MQPAKLYEDFPFPLILLSLLVTVSTYFLGVSILSGFGITIPALYLLFCLGVEIQVMIMGCVDCAYYGKWCAFGRGKVAPFFFGRGVPTRFTSKCLSWKDFLPDMLVLLIPLLGGIALLIHRFSMSRALMLVALLVLSSGGNYLVRSKIACKHCKQRELGCPAEQFFGKQRT